MRCSTWGRRARGRCWVAERCTICGARGLRALAAPRVRGMLSDGAPMGVAVARLACPRCGTAALRHRLPRRIFGAGYALNAGPPSEAEIVRQDAYARRIVAMLRDAPDSVLDIGCGNGALLLALGRHWPGCRRQGVEPAPGAAAAGRRAGVDVRGALTAGRRAALILSVNVIEHTIDPEVFLGLLRRACAPGGRIVLICPDGSTPWLELLMLDHRHSFTPAGIEALARSAGMAVEAHHSEGGFMALLLRPARPQATRRWPPAGGLTAARRRYLGAWRALDAAMPAGPLTCFGVGEAATLLRCYLPGVWSRVVAVTADDLAGAERLGKPVLPWNEETMMRHPILLAVRPQAQAGLAARIAAAGGTPVRWDGRIAR